MVLHSVLPIKAAKISLMTEYNLSEVWYPRTHDQKLLTLCWLSLSWWGREGIAIGFTYNGSQKFHYEWLQPIWGAISYDAWPKIVEATLTLIFMMGQGGYCHLFCLERQPKMWFWLSTTYRRCDFPEHITKNRWRSVDAHFPIVVSTLCNQLVWHRPSFTLFGLPLWCFQFTFFLITTLFFNNK
jgi:hypothetical protein